MTEELKAPKTPAHLWIVGVLSLLWNCVGASDYVFAKIKSDWYMKDVGQFTPDQIAWFYGFPAWADAAWALGVWASLIGSLLLLARSRHAVTAVLASIVGLALMTLYQFVLNMDKFIGLFGPGPMYFTAVIWIIVVALFLYARRQAATGVLR
jgi:hypothetical protein